MSFAARPSSVEDATWIRPVRAAYDRAFPASEGSGHDVGILELPAGDLRIPPAAQAPRAQLPAPGLLDRLAAHGGLGDTAFELVGYGCNHFAATGGPESIDCSRWQRDYATAPFKALTQPWLVLHINGVATGEGGPCFGDSGSPQFLPGTRTIVSVTHAGDRWCRAQNTNYRLDTHAARAFLDDFVALP